MSSPVSLDHGKNHSRLVRWLCTYADETPVEEASTKAAEDPVVDEPATKLYEGCGFRDTGEREPLRPGSPLQLMRMQAEL